MGKPIIGIVGRYELLSEGDDTIMIIDEYRRAVIYAGGIPFEILPVQNQKYSLDKNIRINNMSDEEKEDLIKILKMCDGIIIPGGRRIFEYDIFIAKYVIENNILVLGICLGMQTLAISGCENKRILFPIENGINHRTKDKFVHNVTINKDTFLYNIVKSETFKVNSKHNCNIIEANKFDIVGYSEDGIIEAIEYKNNDFAIGVQWHPEMLIDESEEARKIFKEFIKVIEKKKYYLYNLFNNTFRGEYYMEKQKKFTKGITLISLIITIIVLLILAGVSINYLINQNGIVINTMESKIGTTLGNVSDGLNIEEAGFRNR